jgi:hypothetical protein
MPDLVPVPPVDLHTGIDDATGARQVYFSSTLVNIGAGDFILSATRSGDTWRVEQAIDYSEDGRELVPLEATVVWGGDGHEHWHIEDVARYWMVALDASGEPTEVDPRTDTKVGFCFFDHGFEQPDTPGAPEEPRYTPEGCGDKRDRFVQMGLSVGWADTYLWTLQGQTIDVTGLEDGMYRIWAEADTDGWFREETLDNNLTWADVRLSTRPEDGAPIVDVVSTGPTYSDG